MVITTDLLAVSKRLAAAQALAERMSTSEMSVAKTEEMFGKAVDITSTDGNVEEQISVETAKLNLCDFSDEADKERWRQMAKDDQRRLVYQALVSKAKLYRELERLIWALSDLEAWRSALDSKPP